MRFCSLSGAESLLPSFMWALAVRSDNKSGSYFAKGKGRFLDVIVNRNRTLLSKSVRMLLRREEVLGGMEAIAERFRDSKNVILKSP